MATAEHHYRLKRRLPVAKLKQEIERLKATMDQDIAQLKTQQRREIRAVESYHMGLIEPLLEELSALEQGTHRVK